MGNSGSSISKLACFSQKQRHPSDLPSAEEFNEFRERGQAILRELLSSNNNTKIDWAEVIKTANDLHTQEQAWLKYQSRKERYKFQKRALDRRKKYESTGSFSMNLLTYRNDGSGKERSKNQRQASMASSSSTSCALDDHSSFASTVQATGQVHYMRLTNDSRDF